MGVWKWEGESVRGARGDQMGEIGGVAIFEDLTVPASQVLIKHSSSIILTGLSSSSSSRSSGNISVA